ncbi:MAG TPA: TlpA disulfide reductase family protein [Phnomibacter sp.]|nr:TlpA disulfide reductase family protein [Phnomibacter sp.]
MKRRLLFTLICGVVAGFSTQPLLGQPQTGQPAPDIVLPAPNGEMISLHQQKGKLVLVDFWASWCGPCRVANRALQPVYKKYNPKGFEIFSVSIDDNPDAWRKAIERDAIPWLQVNQRGGWKAPVALAWGINAIPTTFLIDPEGNVLSVDPSHKTLEKYLKKYLKS